MTGHLSIFSSRFFFFYSADGFSHLLELFYSLPGHQEWIWPAVLTFSVIFVHFSFPSLPRWHPSVVLCLMCPPNLHLTSEPQITLFKAAHGPKDAGGAAETCVPSSLVQGTFLYRLQLELQTVNMLFPFFPEIYIYFLRILTLWVWVGEVKWQRCK